MVADFVQHSYKSAGPAVAVDGCYTLGHDGHRACQHKHMSRCAWHVSSNFNCMHISTASVLS